MHIQSAQKPSRNQTPLHKKFTAVKLLLINVFGFDCHYLVFVLGIKFSATGAIFD